MDQPNPIRVAWGILRVLVNTTRPRPTGANVVGHDALRPVLRALADGGLPTAAAEVDSLRDYLAKMATIDPNMLTRDEALAFWINLYNAGAVNLAIEAWHTGEESVLRVPNGFTQPIVTVAGEDLSLHAVEHAKIRRLGDPRIHAALVCGSLSCPTLRATPYVGDTIDGQLDDQMRTFLETGGVVAAGPDRVELSRVFLWYGADFARPHRMPTFLPASKSSVLEAIRPWLPESLNKVSEVGFQEYDWGLACAVR